MRAITKLASILVAFACVMLASSSAFANGRQDYIPTLDMALRVQIQLKLKEQGFFAGPVNGRIGPQTRSAIERYRKARDILEVEEFGEGIDPHPLTLYLTPALIKNLFGLDLGSGTDEIDGEQQAELMRLLRVRKPAQAVDPDS